MAHNYTLVIYIWSRAAGPTPHPPQRVWVHRFFYVGGTSGLPPAPPCGLGGRVCMYMHVWMYVCICM